MCPFIWFVSQASNAELEVEIPALDERQTYLMEGAADKAKACMQTKTPMFEAYQKGEKYVTDDMAISAVAAILKQMSEKLDAVR